MKKANPEVYAEAIEKETVLFEDHLGKVARAA